jgi:hypothetical protein
MQFSPFNRYFLPQRPVPKRPQFYVLSFMTEQIRTKLCITILSCILVTGYEQVYLAFTYSQVSLLSPDAEFLQLCLTHVCRT